MSVLVAVVGSANLDLVARTARIPEPGETVLGSAYSEHHGGKGANQAVGAARAAPTAFVGCVGTDEPGQRTRTHLADRGVATDELRTVQGETGRAVITVADDGENSIVVLPLANHAVTPDQVRESLDRLQPEVVLCQLEIPIESVTAAAEWCERAGKRFLLNPSPVAEVPEHVIALADPLLVNRGEAVALAGGSEDQPLRDALEALRGRARSLVGTDGARGALVSEPEGFAEVPVEPTRAVDTTGAGDEFAGTLAAALASGASLGEAAVAASRAASALIAIQRELR
ncbi:ribokinase [Lysobacter korlensis]|uniref:Ribokinase n=1 Tax=Lysobacter korlensis TaxID=553636 RepID=A0ABV6RYY2_9GAMM